MRRCLVFGLVAAFLVQGAPPLAASSPTWQFTPFGGYTYFEPGLKDNYYAGGRLGWRFHPVVGLQFAGGSTPTEFEAPATGTGDVSFWHAAGALTATAAEADWGDIYLLAGGGYTSTKPDVGTEVTRASFDQGGGLHLWLTRGFGLNLEARNLLLIPNKHALGASHINHIIVGAGLTFGFGGRAKDSDGDGVTDRKDKCPATPSGAKVDANGCPTDADGDGAFDGLDQCAGTPKGAKVDAKGCPTDSDGDGVFDGLDQCADTPKGATVDARGCPSDGDGDGVPDGLDQCANTPKGATVDAKGCPTDSDGDGVVDGLDKCPRTEAGLKVDSDGCPIEVTEKETELLDTGMIRLQGVNFETNKADILPDSYAALDVVGAVLRKWPELKIQIGGHTDSRGSNSANQKLSEARAQSVLGYLTGKFPELKPEQFTSVGFGESQPVAPNTSPLNMAKNRRVEFTVMNRDVLKREVERRKLLQK